MPPVDPQVAARRAKERLAQLGVALLLSGCATPTSGLPAASVAGSDVAMLVLMAACFAITVASLFKATDLERDSRKMELALGQLRKGEDR